MLPLRARPLAAVVTGLTLALPLAVVPLLGATSPASAADAPTVRINEVETSTDWVELINTGASPVDVSGWFVRDDNDERTLTIAPDTVIPAGGFLAVDVDVDPNGFGLGKADAARIFTADGVTLVDSFSWTMHPATSFGRCADGTGEFRETNAATKGAANDCEVRVGDAVRINEIESSGGTPGDWVELTNIGRASVDISGLVLRDGNDASTYVIPADTTIPAGEFVVLNEADFVFGLGGADAVRLFGTDGTTLIDSHSWASHAATTLGRCPDGIGAFAETATSTKGAANDCAAPVASAIVINEIESNGGTPGDWVELVNTGSTATDVSGWVIKDNDDLRTTRLPAGSIVPAGGFLVIEEGTLGFGLGKADSVRLYGADGITLVDSYSWLDHSPTTLSRCPDGTGTFAVSTTSTKAASNDCGAPIRINEVESSGGTPGDWVELRNNGIEPVDASGFVFKDSDDTHSYVIPASTTIAAGGYLVLDESVFGFGLGAADSARLFDADGVTLIDNYSWTAHAATTYARCPDGTGPFAVSSESSKGAANVCEGDVTAAAWPGSASVTVSDVQGYFGGNMSGLAFEGDTLWAVKNGPGELYSLTASAGQWRPTAGAWANGATLRYGDGTGEPDAEGVVVTSTGVFVATERNNSISGTSRPSVLRYDTAGFSGGELRAAAEWNLVSDLPAVGANAGLEGIAWVPDDALTSAGFVDASTGVAYNPASYPGHGDGLFFVGLEANGIVYAYALMADGSFARVATIDSGFPGVMDLEYDPAASALWVVCDDTCDGRTALFEIGTDGAFAATTVFERPAGMPNLNNEGFAISVNCADGARTVVWADDSNTGGHSLRAGALDCAVGGPGTGGGNGGGSNGGGTGGTGGGSIATPTPAPSESLTEAARGSVDSPPSAAPGQSIVITVGTQYAGQRVDVWLHSTPIHLGTHTVSAAGTVTVTIPANAPTGAHRIAVLAADGSVIGWDSIRVGALPVTGTEPAAAGILALVLVLAGATIVVARRRITAGH